MRIKIAKTILLPSLPRSSWLYQDIIRVESDVVPCFPPDYDIFSLYIREYHKAFNTIVKTIAGMKTEASVLLTLYEWLKEYKGNMKELNISPELMEPPLAGREGTGSHRGLRQTNHPKTR